MSTTPPGVLAAVDGGDDTAAVVRRAAELAEHLSTSLAVVHVARMVPALATELVYGTGVEDSVAGLFPDLVEALASSNVPWSLHGREGDPAAEIRRLASELGAEFVVVGAGSGRPRTWWRRRGTVEVLTRTAGLPVVVVTRSATPPTPDVAPRPVTRERADEA